MTPIHQRHRWTVRQYLFALRHPQFQISPATIYCPHPTCSSEPSSPYCTVALAETYQRCDEPRQVARGHVTRGASYTGDVTIHCGGTRDSLCDTLRYTTGRWTRLLRVMHMGAPHVYVRGSGGRAACARWDAAGCAGRGVAAASRGARWRLPSRRVGLISEGVPDGVLGDDRLFTCRCGAAQLGSPQDAPSWSGTT